MKSRLRVFSFFAVFVLLNIAANYVHPVTPPFFQELALPDYMFGVALALMYLTMFAFAPFWGQMSEVLSTRVCMLITTWGYAAAQIVFCTAKGTLGVSVGRLLAGCFAGGIFVGALAYVAGTSPAEKRGSYMAAHATVQAVGSAFGYFFGGMTGLVGVRLTFYVQIAILLLCGVLCMLVMEDDRRGAARPEMGSVLRKCNPLSSILAGRSFMDRAWAKLMGMCLLFYVGHNAFEQVFNYYLRAQFGLPTSWNGTIKFAVAIISMAANATVAVYLLNKTDFRKTSVPVFAAAAAMILGVILAPALSIFMGAAFLYYILNSVSQPLVQNLIASRAKASQTALVMGFYQAFRSIGGMIGSLFAGVLYTAWPKLPFLFACAAVLTAAALEAWYAGESGDASSDSRNNSE